MKPARQRIALGKMLERMLQQSSKNNKRDEIICEIADALKNRNEAQSVEQFELWDDEIVRLNKKLEEMNNGTT